jgi:hypothetical protein
MEGGLTLYEPVYGRSTAAPQLARAKTLTAIRFALFRAISETSLGFSSPEVSCASATARPRPKTAARPHIVYR